MIFETHIVEEFSKSASYSDQISDENFDPPLGSGSGEAGRRGQSRTERGVVQTTRLHRTWFILGIATQPSLFGSPSGTGAAGPISSTPVQGGSVASHGSTIQKSVDDRFDHWSADTVRGSGVHIDGWEPFVSSRDARNASRVTQEAPRRLQ